MDDPANASISISFVSASDGRALPANYFIRINASLTALAGLEGVPASLDGENGGKAKSQRFEKPSWDGNFWEFLEVFQEIPLSLAGS